MNSMTPPQNLSRNPILIVLKSDFDHIKPAVFFNPKKPEKNTFFNLNSIQIKLNEAETFKYDIFT